MKILPCGVAVIEGDTHVSKWVAQHGRLRIAENMLSPFRKYVPVGGVVVDAGAMIGDHTATYADWVGPTGRVYAVEPNTKAFECLIYNTSKMRQVTFCNCGLSDHDGWTSMVKFINAGASYLSGDSGDVELIKLDNFCLDRLDFLKMDVEGWEVKLLKGAVDTIKRCRPVILAEVNAGALDRAGSSQLELLSALLLLGYNKEITDSRLSWSDPQYDVICTSLSTSSTEECRQ